MSERERVQPERDYSFYIKSEIQRKRLLYSEGRPRER